MNVPNTLTMFRVLFSIAVFYFIAVGNYDLCLLFFVLAAVTDFFDGWWARTFKQITVFGRIMDPFADKLLICGTFICLVTIPQLTSDPAGGFPSWFMLQPWMVIVIVSRELLITSLRAMIESSGGDFSAKWVGKWKMALQCVAIIACLLYLAGGAERAFLNEGKYVLASEFYKSGVVTPHHVSWVATHLDEILDFKFWRNIAFYTMIASLWLTIAITIDSGITYSLRAAKVIGKKT